MIVITALYNFIFIPNTPACQKNYKKIIVYILKNMFFKSQWKRASYDIPQASD